MLIYHYTISYQEGSTSFAGDKPQHAAKIYKNGDFLEETENLTYLFTGELDIENCFTIKAVDNHGTVGPESNQECGTGTDS